MVQLLWKMVWWFLKSLNIELLYDPAVPLLAIYPKRIESRVWEGSLYTHVHSSIIHVIHNSQKMEKPSTDGWINKMWSVCTVEYYSALKRKNILTLATTWMNFEEIVLSEINQAQKDKYCMIPLI